MQFNERVSESRQKLTDLPVSTIQTLSDCLLHHLGDPVSQLEKDALRSLKMAIMVRLNVSAYQIRVTHI